MFGKVGKNFLPEYVKGAPGLSSEEEQGKVHRFPRAVTSYLDLEALKSRKQITTLLWSLEVPGQGVSRYNSF